MKVIIHRASAYHLPDIDPKKYGANFYCVTELLRKDFLEMAIADGGIFMLPKVGLLLEGYERIQSAMRYGDRGVLYDKGGTVDEFLMNYSSISMMRSNVKYCSICNEYFVSPPSEWYKHMCAHMQDQKERFRIESFDYYFGPD